MKEFAPKLNTNKIESKEASESERVDLNLLAEKISKYEPDSQEFFKLKNSFMKSMPFFRERIRGFVELYDDSIFSLALDSEYEKYFILGDKLGLLTEEDKEIFYELFKLGQMRYEITDKILEKREFYKDKNKEKKEKQEERDKKLEKEELSEFILKKMGFSSKESEELIGSWFSVQQEDLLKWYISENLQNIKNLEGFEKGSVKYLFDNFGIRGFGRYRLHELKKQYEERENMGPYGVFFQAVFDSNGSFVNSNQSESLGEKVEEHDFLIRIVEADGKIDLAKRLLYLRDKYDQKIKFMYMHVHGHTSVVGLGDRKGSNRLLLQKDLEGKGVQRVKNLFEDDAELILSSCLTGIKGGLAEEMANTYDVKVIAADKPTVGEPISIDIEKTPDGNNLKFDIIFNTAEMEDKDWGEIEKRSDLFGTVTYNPKNKN